ncbi:MAG: polysaccharide biosynthesis tyrosine autokinase, partial [Muribaculaceae bacterium]|nr:polysaccharide biosynthesis tyrosine autokinase [Muribaculaceae bacterium]
SIADTIRGSLLFDVRVKADGKDNVRVLRNADKKIVDEDFDGFPYDVKTPYGTFTLVSTDYLPKDEDIRTKITFMGYDVAAEKLAKDIKVDIASQKSNMLQMSMITPDIEYGKDLLNDIIYQYNIKGMASKRNQAEQTYTFIDQRLDSIANELRMSEIEVEAYKNENGIVDVKTEAQVSLNRREKYEANLVLAEADLEVINMTIAFLKDPANANSLIPTATNMEHASEAIGDYNKMVLEYMRLQGTAKGNNRALQTLEEQMTAMRENIVSSLMRARNQQQILIAEIKKQVSSAEASLGNIPEQERQFRAVERRHKILEELYLYLLQRKEETGMMAANALPKGDIIDQAYALNEPVGLKNKMVLVLAFLFGMCIPPVLIYLSNIFRSKFSTREEVEKVVDVPILGEICLSRSAVTNPLVVTPTSTSPVAELFRLVRANLNFMLRNKGDKVVLVTSTSSGEGKSFISINMAASLALLGKKVLLVGMDIRNPQLARYLHLTARFGLTQYLSSEDVKLSDILLKEPVAENMDVIVAGPVPPNPSELLCESVVDDFIDAVKPNYDYVIIDSAPVGMVSDTFALDRVADATIYVCRANFTSIKDLKFIETIRTQERLKNMALIINGTTSTKGYGYGADVNKKRKKGE